MGNALSATLPEDWITIDMVNRFTFCPRLFHLMYVEGRWEDNHFTLEGKAIHRRVDRVDQILPEANEETIAENHEGDSPPEIARSVSLAAEDLGMMGKLDLVSCDPEGGEAIPVETKRGRVPNVPLRAYPPERAQVMAQALLLRRHGYTCDHGYLYFAGSRTRVRVDLDEELERSTLETIASIREARGATEMPPPLEDSPKCWGCSLCGICLPDETRELQAEPEEALKTEPSPLGSDPRRLFPARDRATPFYIQEQGARVGKTGERLVVTKEHETIGESRLIETSQLVLFGNVQVSAQALHLCMEKGIPVIHMSTGAWFHGISHGTGVENAYNRAAQYAAAADPAFCVRFIIPLAVDFMEPFRPILADSAVLTCINTGMVRPKDFITNSNGCAMQPAAKKAILRAWEQRLDQLHTHAEFGYRCSWRTILRIQARLLVRLLRDDITHLPWPTERDDSAEICRDSSGQPEPDTELNYTENLPLKENIETYIAREVNPHVPDAWIDPTTCDAKDGKVGKVGYEIPFNRHFYVFQPLRPLSAIDADLKASTGRILNLIGGLMQ